MKITAIHTFILRVPLGEKRFFSSQCAFPERNSFLVRIDTDAGISGWGEGGQYGPAEPLCACVEHVLAPEILGQNPLHKDVLWTRMYNLTRDFGQKGAYIEAISAIDIALWDICGKALNVPVGVLMGGRYRERVSTYATGCYYRGEDCLNVDNALGALADEARGYVDAGFNMVKIKVGLLSVADDYRRVKAIRKAIGDDIGLLVDANHAYTVPTALRMGKMLEEQGALFFEEPVVPENRDGYCRVREGLSLAIAGGECEYTRYGFRELFERQCVDIAQPDIGVCGGLSEFQKITAMADAFGVLTLPHVWGSGIAFAAALAAISNLPLQPHTANPVPLQNEPIVEYDRNFNPLRDDLLQEKVVFKNGMVEVPTGPGLGVAVDEAVLGRYTTYHNSRQLDN